MMPAPSLCGTIVSKAGLVIPGRPARALTSEGLTPEKRSSTTTSFSVGSEISMSVNSRTSEALPNAEYETVRMSCPSRVNLL